MTVTSHICTADLLVGGRRTPAADGRTFSVLDPAHGTPIAEVALAGRPDVDRAVAAARAALTAPEWARMRTGEDRKSVV